MDAQILQRAREAEGGWEGVSQVCGGLLGWTSVEEGDMEVEVGWKGMTYWLAANVAIYIVGFGGFFGGIT